MSKRTNKPNVIADNLDVFYVEPYDHGARLEREIDEFTHPGYFSGSDGPEDDGVPVILYP